MAPGEISFRKLRDDEEAKGYQVLCDAVSWLRGKKIELWRNPLPAETYSARHAKGRNFGLFVGDRIAVIVSLMPSVPEYWTGEIENPNATWLCTMATANEFRGRKLGFQTLEQAKSFLAMRGEKELYLDCKPGFLETFYKSAGFLPIKTRELPIPHASPTGPIFATLMRCSLTKG